MATQSGRTSFHAQGRATRPDYSAGGHFWRRLSRQKPGPTKRHGHHNPSRSNRGIGSLEHFRTYGWVRIPTAFSAPDAAAMCGVIWAALAKVGIQCDEPAKWTTARPVNRQHLKAKPAFHGDSWRRSRNARSTTTSTTLGTNVALTGLSGARHIPFRGFARPGYNAPPCQGGKTEMSVLLRTRTHDS